MVVLIVEEINKLMYIVSSLSIVLIIFVRNMSCYYVWKLNLLYDFWFFKYEIWMNSVGGK